MKIIFGKNLSNEERNLIREISDKCDISFDTARLLFYRGISSVAEAKCFLDPSKKQLHDPYLLGGMEETVKRINLARDKKERVLIFGDYDADGISATTVLYFSLKEYGIDALKIVPEREDGYGLNLDKIFKIHEETPLGLIITVDCGISDNEKIEELKKKGIDVIVTDHHEPPEILPDCIKINPKIKGQNYPFDGLCGAGVAYKVAYALIGENANEYLDFVALATVADSVDLTDENRVIVSLGLKILNSKYIKYPFKFILGDSQKSPVTSQTLAYVVAPRVNAGGRMGDAKSVLDTFTSDNPSKIYELAVKLNKYNIERQAGCDLIYREAKSIIRENGLLNKEVLLVKKDGWSSGFIGIVASKLVEDFNRPVIVFAGKNGVYKGSCRSIDGINIYDALTYSGEYLIGYGGHSQAAGVTVTEENFSAFESKICEFVKNKYGETVGEKTLTVDWEIDKEISIKFARELEKLEPFGTGNRRPLFCLKENSIIPNRLKENSPHYTFDTKYISMLDFNGEGDVFNLTLPVDKFVFFEINYSVFKNRESVKGIVKKIENIDTENVDLSLYAFENELDKILLKNDGYSVETDEIKAEEGFGTVYLVSDVENFGNCEINGLKSYYFYPPEKNPKNCVVISPKSIQENFVKAVYLDTSLSPLFGDTFKTFVPKISCVSDKYRNLFTDRETFSVYYSKLLSKLDEKHFSIAEMSSDIGNLDSYQFIFCAKVFFELNIFYLKNGILKRNGEVKTALENSLIYRKIKSLTEVIC